MKNTNPSTSDYSTQVDSGGRDIELAKDFHYAKRNYNEIIRERDRRWVELVDSGVPSTHIAKIYLVNFRTVLKAVKRFKRKGGEIT